MVATPAGIPGRSHGLPRLSYLGTMVTEPGRGLRRLQPP
jgi:hypothetical protein